MSHAARHTVSLDDKVERAERQLALLDGPIQAEYNWRGLAFHLTLSAPSGQQRTLGGHCDIGTLPFSVETSSGRAKAVEAFRALRRRPVPGVQFDLIAGSAITMSFSGALSASAGPAAVQRFLALALLDVGQELTFLAGHLR